MSLKADPRSTVSHFNDTVEACKSTYDATKEFLLSQFKHFHRNGSSFEEVEIFFEIDSPFNGITTERELIKEFKTTYNLNESKDIILGSIDNTYDDINLKKKKLRKLSNTFLLQKL